MFSSLSSRVLFLFIITSSIIGCSGASNESVLNAINASAFDEQTVTSNEQTVTGEEDLVPFVVAASDKTGVATLSWMPPIENTDGSQLTDLAGYVIYYGKTIDSLTESVSINNPGLTSYTIENLDSNTMYYYTITSINNSNIQSGYSSISNKNTASES